ncbi:hypothetical protein C7C45_32960, partial [Micromonospora arborensis]
GATRVDPDELAGQAGGLSPEGEHDKIFILASGMTSVKGLVLATREGLTAKVDDRPYLLGADGRLHRRADADLVQPAVEVKYNILEVTPEPTVLHASGDRGRPSWQSVYDPWRQATDLMQHAPIMNAREWREGQGLAIEDIFRADDGWVITEEGRGARVFSPYLHSEKIYVQWNVGVPVADLANFYEFMAQRTFMREPKRLLLEGMQFANDVAARYLGVFEGSVRGLMHFPGVVELIGFMTLAYTHVAARIEHSALSESSGMLSKNAIAAALRNPPSVVRAELPEAVRMFLNAEAPAIRSLLVDRYRAGKPDFDRRYAERHNEKESGSIDILRLGHFPYRNEQYLDNFLLDRPQRIVDQHRALGINEQVGQFAELDDNGGLLTKSVVLEIRNDLDRMLTIDELDVVHSWMASQFRQIRARSERQERPEPGRLRRKRQFNVGQSTGPASRGGSQPANPAEGTPGQPSVPERGDAQSGGANPGGSSAKPSGRDGQPGPRGVRWAAGPGPGSGSAGGVVA